MSGNKISVVMKNIYSIIFMSALMLSGCVQEEISDNSPYCEGREFTASFEEAGTRTYVEDGVLLRWTSGDDISLFDGNTLNRQYRFDGETGDNSGTFSIVSAPYGSGNDLNANYAVYPYSSDVKITEGGVVTVTLPSEQSYAEDSFGLGANTMAAVTKDTDDTFLRFRNTCGYLKLQLYGEDVTVRSITLTGNGDERLAGKATVATSYGQEPVVSMSDEAGATVVLDCGEGVEIGSTAETATAFWIVVPPVTFEDGFTVTVEDADGGTFSQSTSNEIKISRNVIKPMKAFEVECQEAEEAVLVLSQKEYTVSDAGGTISVDIKSNIEYSVQMPDVDWIEKVETRALQEHTLHFKVAENPDIINRTAKIVFLSKDGMLRETIAVTQLNYAGNHKFYFNYEGMYGVVELFQSGVLRQILELYKKLDGDTNLTKLTIAGPINGDDIKVLNKVYSSDSRFEVDLSDATIVEGGESYYAKCYTKDNVIGSHMFTESNAIIITLPQSATTIDQYAFYNSGLVTINTGDGIASINNYAFSGATSLRNIYIGKGVTSIGYKAFDKCRSLSNIVIPGHVTDIYSEAFYGCNNLRSVTIENGVTNIGDRAFAFCNSIESIVIPNSVINMGLQTFYGCSSLKYITIGNSLADIGYDTFNSCTSLKSVVIPDSVTSIGECAFMGCNSLSSITIGNSVKTIGSYAFYDCSSLESIVTPDSVTSIGECAFMNCNSLRFITIGDGVTTIEENAFNGCDLLDSVYITNLSAWCNISFKGVTTANDYRPYCTPLYNGAKLYLNNKELTELVIPKDINRINALVFYGCSSITSVQIGDGVTEIGCYAFRNCDNLTKIYCRPAAPPTVYNAKYWKAFDNNGSGRKIYVPQGSADVYKAAEGWSAYASDIVGYDF